MNLQYINFLNENCSNTSPSLLNEAVQEAAVQNALNRIFTATIAKYKKISFNEVERTRGDITKLKYYKQLDEAVTTLEKLHQTTGKINDIVTVRTTINNLIKYKPNFEKSFRIQNAFAIMIYNLMVYGVMESTSYIIAASIDFINEDTGEIIVTGVDGSTTLISQLSRFNKMCDDGSIMKILTETDNAEVVTEATGLFGAAKSFGKATAKELGDFWGNLPLAGKVIAISGGVLIILVSVIPIIRFITYHIYETRHNISQAAAEQAMLLELNIEILQVNGAEPKIIAKQKKWVERFKSLSRKFALESDTGEQKAEKSIKSEKIDSNDIIL